MKKKLIPIFIAITLMSQITGCASCGRAWVDFKSDVGGGLNRTINIYTANGDLMATYSGKIDLEMTQGGYLKFDYKYLVHLLNSIRAL